MITLLLVSGAQVVHLCIWHLSFFFILVILGSFNESIKSQCSQGVVQIDKKIHQ